MTKEQFEKTTEAQLKAEPTVVISKKNSPVTKRRLKSSMRSSTKRRRLNQCLRNYGGA